MSKIPDDIRSKIAQLDELVGAIKEWFEDNREFDYNDNYRDDFQQSLETLQDDITTIQEKEGWI